MPKSKKQTEKIDQFNITFSKNEKEQDLYKWLDEMIGRGAFIKRILYKAYLEESKGQYFNNVNIQSTNNSSDILEVTEEETEIGKSDFKFE